MVQDTRKDPRAKVLTMTVRYKSATVDEFIEHHSHDISRGGIFIKTASPFPPGTLLKFEIRISGETTVMGGVGRVVWKREPPQAGGERPAGMGVKFLKIDEPSRQVIDRIINAQTDEPSAYEAGAAEAARTVPAPAASALSTAQAAPTSRKVTMLGLGYAPTPAAAPASEHPAGAEAKPAVTPPPPAEQAFFPATNSEAEMPPMEERTVMRQAAELLSEALKGAGGSLDEIGTSPDVGPTPSSQVQPVAVTPAPAPAPEMVQPAIEKEPVSPAAVEPSEPIGDLVASVVADLVAAAEQTEPPAEKAETPGPVAAEEKPATPEPVEAKAPEVQAAAEVKDAVQAEPTPAPEPATESKTEPETKPEPEPKAEEKAAEPPAAAAATITVPSVASLKESKKAEEKGSGVRWAAMTIGVLVVAGGVYWLTHSSEPEPVAPQPTQTAAPAVASTPPALSAASPAPVVSAAPTTEPSAASASAPAVVASTPPAVASAPSPVLPAKPVPAAAAAPAEKPAVAAPTPKPAPEKPKPAPAVAAAPAEKPAPPAPKPKPKKESDNPYE